MTNLSRRIGGAVIFVLLAAFAYAQYLMFSFLWAQTWGPSASHAIAGVILFIFLVCVCVPVDVLAFVFGGLLGAVMLADA